MNTRRLKDPTRRLQKTLNTGASVTVDVRRDRKDNFDIVIRSRTNQATPLLTSDDVLPLLPAGSRWSGAVDSYSYFGIPFHNENGVWLAIGLIRVLRHSTRGAYPRMTALVFPFEKVPTEELARLAESIS